MTLSTGTLKRLLLVLGLTAALVSFPTPNTHATVSNQEIETTTALGTGAVVNFTIGFQFQSNADVHVFLRDEGVSPAVVTEVVPGPGPDGFLVTGGNPGTTVTMGTPPTVNQRLVIKRQMPFTQTVDYDENDAFPAEAHERAMDKQILLLQQLNGELDKCLRFPFSSSYSNIFLPDPSAGMVLAWNNDGSAIVNVDPNDQVVVPTLAQVLLQGSSAGSSSIDLNGQQILKLRPENLSADPAPGSAGRIFWNTALQQWRGDTGAAIVPLGGNRTMQGSWGVPVAVSASSGITAANARSQVVYVIGQGGAVDISGHNPQITAGFADGDELTIYGTNSTNTVHMASGNGIVFNGDVTFRAHGVCTFTWNQGASVWTQKGWCNDL